MTKHSGQFKKGESGNPAGKKPGTKNRYTRFRKMVDSDAPDLVKKVMEMALDGDLQACRLILERIWPATAEKEMMLEAKLEEMQKQLDELTR